MNKTELNQELVLQNIPKYSSQKLCEMIICSRYFGNNKEIAVNCMEELAMRRITGDNFDFEGYIESSYNELPSLEISIPNISEVIKEVIGRKIRL